MGSEMCIRDRSTKYEVPSSKSTKLFGGMCLRFTLANSSLERTSLPARNQLCTNINFGVTLGSLWGHFGVTLASLWGHNGVTLGSLWDQLGIILGSLWDHFGIILGSLWGHFGVILESFGTHFGIILGSFWSHFGKLSLGGTWHGRLGEPAAAGPGEPGGTAEWTQHIKNESKNPISRA